MKELTGNGINTPSSVDVLRQYGHKITPQRFMILSVIEETNEHLCLEQIVQRVQQRNPQVNQTTIYRNLFLLQQLDVIRPTYFPGKSLCYEIVTEREHHHFLCKRCQIILHLDHDSLANLFEHVESRYHVYDLTLSLLATGYCEACWQILQQENNGIE